MRILPRSLLVVVSPLAASLVRADRARSPLRVCLFYVPASTAACVNLRASNKSET